LAVAVLPGARPHHQEVARVAGRDAAEGLVARGVRVDLELGAERRAGAVETLAEDTEAGAVLRFAAPDADEIAAGAAGQRNERLRSGRI
jgi:hypothetical protein